MYLSGNCSISSETANSQKMEEESDWEEEEWAREAKVMEELHIPPNPECFVFWFHPWELHIHTGP